MEEIGIDNVEVEVNVPEKVELPDDPVGFDENDMVPETGPEGFTFMEGLQVAYMCAAIAMGGVAIYNAAKDPAKRVVKWAKRKIGESKAKRAEKVAEYSSSDAESTEESTAKDKNTRS